MSTSTRRSGQLAAIKVIPFGRGATVPVNGEPQTTAMAIYQEIGITRTLANLSTDGELDTEHGMYNRANFVRLYRAGLCKGEYPEDLLQAWDIWDDNIMESENTRPDYFDAEQLYAVLILEYGGQDLEHYRLTSWCQAESLLKQVAWSLAIAEKSLNFEHRDLHWGNVLIAPIDTEVDANNIVLSNVMPNTDVHLAHCGIRCIIIDYTLSRLETENELLYVELEDNELFEGEGDYQFEVYRRMRQHTASRWEEFHPITNVEWIYYLLEKLLNDKKLPN
ncbi:hypothetical protein BDF19DRAFT_280894 [Syncephalis fuscata]|nr:hypothetical protein BDF19DRAFT_280894 [Syncephalis fuscata]